MCRNIKTLFNFEPPATHDEVHAASLQFVRKLSGFNKPSKANEAAFELAIERVADAANELLGSLVTSAPPRDREVEAAKAHPNITILEHRHAIDLIGKRRHQLPGDDRVLGAYVLNAETNEVAVETLELIAHKLQVEHNPG